jgi:phage I-like protein
LKEAIANVDHRIIEKAATERRQGEAAIILADKTYLKMLRAQDSITASSPMFQQIAALSAVETELKISASEHK